MKFSLQFTFVIILKTTLGLFLGQSTECLKKMFRKILKGKVDGETEIQIDL